MLLSQVEAMREQLRPSERKLADYVWKRRAKCSISP